MTVHLLREYAYQAGHVHVRSACANGAWRLPAGADLPGYASGWSGDVGCDACMVSPVRPEPWKRGPTGRVIDFGPIRPVAPHH